MPQRVDKMGIPATLAVKDRPPLLLSETLLVALLTALIYTFAGAYEFGYQDVFGFTYIALGIEDVIGIMREFLVPIIFAITISLVSSFVLMIAFRTRSTDRLTTILFLVTPVVVSGLFYAWFARGDRYQYIEKSIPWMLAAYYLLDPLIWGGVYRAAHRRGGATSFVVPTDRYFRLAQLVTGCLLLILCAYSVGAIDARNMTYPTQCPDQAGKSSIMIQQTGEVTICAEVNFATNEVYQRLLYFKLGDASPESFRVIRFHPSRIVDP